MLGEKFAVKFVLLIAFVTSFVDSKPARGESESFAAEGEPPRVAEADKTTHFIGTLDVLTSNEKAYLLAETQSKGTFYLLKKDSTLTDLTENYLAELSTNQKCAKEMEILDECLRNRGSGKVSINTVRVTQARKPNEIDCTNNQIDLEQCVITNNRYYPCAPLSRDLSFYKNLFVERALQLANIVEPAGFILARSNQSFDFGFATGYEIVNYNETYENYVGNFQSRLPKNDLQEPYESFKNNFLKIQSIVPANSLNFNKLKDAFRSAICRREVLNFEEAVSAVTSTEKKFKKPSPELKEAFEKFNSSLKDFLKKFPTEVQEKCVNEHQHQAHVANKIKILELLNLNC